MTITAAVPRPDLRLAQGVEIHRRVDDLVRGHERHGRAAGNDREQIVPAAADAAAMLVDEFAEGKRHRLLHVAGLVHVAGHAEQLGAGVVLGAEAREPGRAAAQDGAGATAIDSTLFTVVGQP